MNPLQPFCLESTVLEPGLTLIEASAGTGKTYTIAGIVLRLVLERGMALQEILVVTYTVAATQELRDRVRKRLRDGLEALRAGSSEDPLLAAFLATGDVEKGIRALDVAVQSFDEAQIFTIHGFCQRVLQNNAFASGVLFEMELLADPSAILEEVAHDFWRQRFYCDSTPLLPRLALAHGRSFSHWTTLLGRMGNHPDLTVLPPRGTDSCALLRELDALFIRLRQQWQSDGTTVMELLRNGVISRKKDGHFNLEALGAIELQLSELFADLESAVPVCLGAISAFSRSEVEAAALKKAPPPSHPFFDLCEEFKALTARLFYQLDHEFIEFARAELPLRKERRHLLTYDDLLIRLRAGLQGANGQFFAKALGGKYRAALIDEFQDTDPIQFEIFHRVFVGTGHFLFFIGDPKQAIYGFRGADVFTYLRAHEKADHSYTLGTNFRSEKPLLDAVNALFDVASPFLVSEIKYRAVEPPATSRPGFATLQEATPLCPLQFRSLVAAPGDRPFNQSDAEEIISQAVVADILRLQSNSVRLGNRPLSLGDIAVLVRSNHQASELQALLRKSHIKSVLHTDASVFETEEAIELLRLLEAVLEPGRDVMLKTGLSTCFIGLDAADLLAFDSDPARWQCWLDSFLLYRQIWEEGCFIALFRHVLVDQKVRARLLAQPGGERRLTNFLHLSELLHQAETDLRLTPEALCNWLREQRHHASSGSENHQLRLESDEDAVLLATIHKSKGLEYPIVFCPFLFKPGDNQKRQELLFHDPAAEYRMTLDLRSKSEVPEHDRLTKKEREAEALRVLYVALTRAQNRCYVYAGDISKFEDSPLGYLLGPGSAWSSVENLAAKAPGAIGLSQIEPEADFSVPALSPIAHELTALKAREFVGRIPAPQMITSFSGLISGRASEDPDRDSTELLPSETELEGDFSPLAKFERGQRAGVFLHEVLEQLDFQAPEQLERLVGQKLLAHGIAPGAWPDVLCRVLKQMLESPLAPQIAPGLALKHVTHRLAEVEFSHPILPLRPDRLAAVFKEHGGPEIPSGFAPSLGRLHFRPLEGYMRGFIDLLFEFEGRYYLLDWKSNFLGERLSHYDEPGMRACMLHHAYYLQYHLYTVATDLFLRQRLPNYSYQTHFGGVLYLFLRGIDPKRPGSGVFFDRPNPELIGALRQLLVGPSL